MMKQTITLKTDELLYDVRNGSHLLGKSQEAAGANYKSVSLMQIGDSEQEMSKLKRSLSTAFAECVEMIYPYTKETIQGEEISNILDDPQQEYTIAATFPDTLSVTTLSLLKELLHSYMVNTALADWAEYTDPQNTVFAMAADRSRMKIHTALMSRIKMPERRLSAF